MSYFIENQSIDDNLILEANLNHLHQISLNEMDLTFDKYIQKINRVFNLLNKYQIKSGPLFFPNELEKLSTKFHLIPDHLKQKKFTYLDNSIQFYNEIEKNKNPFDDKYYALSAFLKKYRLNLPNEKEALKSIDKDTYIEIYDKDLIQVFRSYDFFEITNHSLMALETYEWWELFYRSEIIVQQQMKVLNEIFSGQIRHFVANPVELHTVKEINIENPISSQTESLLYAPLFDNSENFQGGVHLFKVYSSQSLKFKVLDN